CRSLHAAVEGVEAVSEAKVAGPAAVALPVDGNRGPTAGNRPNQQ
ncbi:MAG: hypothetical protein JWN14_2025, partial [Chthonomonadales bacterium]|nr:hypothetical protein [Chthonomonadales bacterium]